MPSRCKKSPCPTGPKIRAPVAAASSAKSTWALRSVSPGWSRIPAPRWPRTACREAVRGHRGAGILDHPGETDLSAHVDFAELAAATGARIFGPVGQGDFLQRLGIAHRAQTLKAHATTEQRLAVDAALQR